MNIPSVYRKALDGFVIPPRTFFQMVFSAAQGAASLFKEPNRADFINELDNGTINESVISQATAGPMMMLSLFHDLQNPLFQRCQFDAKEFLDGVGPALENFHNTSGGLENELRRIQEEALAGENVSGKEETEKDDSSNSSTSKEVEEALSAFGVVQGNAFFSKETSDKSVSSVMNHEWMEEAKKKPESLAGQLSQMLTTELFQIHQISAKTAYLLQNNSRNNIQFQEGSCTVNNVALLSARCFLCAEKDDDEAFDDGRSRRKFETVDFEIADEEMESKRAGVAAQLEVLYDVTQEFIAEKSNMDEGQSDDHEQLAATKSNDTEVVQTTIVSVATLEGWLKGGPNGELRWRLALHRPAFEFPGIQRAY